MGYQQYVIEARMKDINSEGRSELDTHADTCVAKANTVILDLTRNHVSVTPFCDKEYEPIIEIPIPTVGTAYNCPYTARVWVLIINEALYFGSMMANTLLCPNQLWQHGIEIEDCPRQFYQSSSHSIFIPSHKIHFPLSLNGIISGLITRQPTDEELEDFSLHIEMASSEQWDPYSMDYALPEEKLQNDDTQMRSWNINSDQIIEINTVEDETLLMARLISAVKLSSEQAYLSDMDNPNI